MRLLKGCYNVIICTCIILTANLSKIPYYRAKYTLLSSICKLLLKEVGVSLYKLKCNCLYSLQCLSCSIFLEVSKLSIGDVLISNTENTWGCQDSQDARMDKDIIKLNA